ncbi:ER membrane protein complex subunit 8 [Diabrotica virgifera virgifera]|uniref:ER membrane protein complex subunit 8 n=1 Tax=Diabrotica virgifera virgifera TaxID=50390 RepID=A0A6P7FKM4_DIAVI|nr:ER membrane protein complex subunit 8 [Diabrotica virgifera virgifera]
MTSIKFTEQAYCKMILHASKYPHCTVNGILLTKSSPNNKEVEFVDCVPLFHVCINLTPMAEIALMQIDEYASKKNLTIAGYYVAPENPRDTSFDKMYNRISDKIASNCSPSYVVIVNSTANTIQRGKIALKVGQYNDGSLKQCDDISVSDDAMNVCISGLNDSLYEKLVDFDNHLDDISLDWTNSELNKEIHSFL